MMGEAGSLTRDVTKPRSGGRRGRVRRYARRLLIVLLALWVLPYVIVPIYALVNPPVTPVMLQNALVHWTGIHKSWVAIEDISPRLVRAVLAAEDSRFCSHHGIDWVEVRKALEDDDGPARGASTISMQTARNLFFPGGRSWLRKGLEVPLALYLDLVLSKRRIMEIYLNIAEWGVGVYGAGEAAERAYGVPPAKLTSRQAALLAATLPSPLARNPAKPGRGLSRMAGRISARAATLGDGAECVLE